MDTRSNGAGGAPLGTINRSVPMYSAPEVDEKFEGVVDIEKLDEAVGQLEEEIQTTKEGLEQEIEEQASKVYRFKGTKQRVEDLPVCEDSSEDSAEGCPKVGDTYNVLEGYEDSGESIPPGTNWAWNGEKWDPLAGSLADYLSKSEAAEIYLSKEVAAETYATKESLTAGLAGKADKVDATLVPIYEGGHTEPFSEWLFDKPAFVVIGDFGFNASSGEWVIEFGDQQDPYSYTGKVSGTLNDTEVVFDYSEGLGVIITATRTAYALTSYRLGPSDGPNADKPLQPAGAYATKEEVALVRDAANDSATQVQTKEDPITLGTGNAALSANSLAEGASNTAGLKGYRYTNTKPVTNSLTFEVAPDGWATGDVVSIINVNKYADCAVIASISGNTVTFMRNLPFSSIASDTGWDAKIAYVSTKPDKGNVDLGYGAHAEGIGSKALNAAAHAEGRKTQALGQYSHAEGRETKAQYCAHAEGEGTEAVGTRSHAEGQGTRANNNYAHAEGLWTVAGGEASHSEGSGAEARGDVAHAEGINTQAIGYYSHAEGESTTAEGSRSHSEGIGTLAAGHFSHAEGANAVTGAAAKKDSRGETIDGCFAHAEGNGTYAKGAASHAEGWETQAHGRASHAEGNYTQALNFYEHAEGQLNKSNKASNNFGDSGNTLHSIGIGFGSTRMNAVEVMQDGKAYVKDIGGYDGTNPGGNRDLAAVLAAMASTASIESTDRAALHALTELDSTTDLQATKDTINTLMKVLKALVPAASAVFMFILSALGVDSLNSMNPTNLVYTAGEVDEFVYTQALSRAEAEKGFTEWDFTHAPSLITRNPELKWNAQRGDWVIYLNGEVQTYFPGSVDDVRVNLGVAGEYATRTRLRPTPEMEASWDAKASTNDVELTPVYGGNGEKYSAWVCNPAEYAEEVLSISKGEPYESEEGTLRDWILQTDGTVITTIPLPADQEPVSLDFSGYTTATRTENPSIGYTLGNQTNSVFASTNALEKYATTNDVDDIHTYVATQALSRAEAEKGFTEWKCEPAAVNGKAVIIRPSSTQWYPTNADGDSGMPRGTESSESLTWAASGWWGNVALTATRTRLRPTPEMETAWNNKQDTIADLATIRYGAALGATAVQPAALNAALAEAAQFRKWFPGGEAKSIADCTPNLEFDWANANETNHTVDVLPFCNTGTEHDNSDISGRVVIPPYVETNGGRYAVVGVADGNYADGNTRLTAIIAPTTVASIGNDAFAGCTSLSSVSLPAVTSIGDYAFASCTALPPVSLPAATSIGDYAFGGCTSLASVSIPAATTIGDYAFSNCDPLASVSLPAATSIGSSAFADCGSLTSVDFGSIVRTSVPALSSNAFPTLSGHTCRIIVPDDNYSAWVTNQNWAPLTSQGYQFTKSGGTYLKDANGIFWKLTVGTDGVLGATAATNTVNQVSQ